MLTFLRDERVSVFPKSQPRSNRVKRYQKYLKGSSAFVFKAGFEELIMRLTNILKFNKVDVKNGTTIDSIKQIDQRFTVHYTSNGQKGKISEMDFLISALPANKLSDVFKNSIFTSPKKAKIDSILGSIKYADMVTLNYAYSFEDSQYDKMSSESNEKWQGHVLTPSKYLKHTKGVLGVLAMHRSFHQNGEYLEKHTSDFSVDNNFYLKSRIPSLRNRYINNWARSYPELAQSPESDQIANMRWYSIMLGGQHFPDSINIQEEELFKIWDEYMEKVYGVSDQPDYVTLK